MTEPRSDPQRQVDAWFSDARNWESLARFARCQNVVDWEDTLSVTYEVAHRRASEFEGRSSLGTWIRGIHFNVIRAWRRLYARRYTFEALPNDPPYANFGDDAHPEALVGMSDFMAWLETLDPQGRAIALDAIMGIKPAEQAECHRLSIHQFYRARTRVRKSLRQRFSHPALALMLPGKAGIGSLLGKWVVALTIVVGGAVGVVQLGRGPAERDEAPQAVVRATPAAATPSHEPPPADDVASPPSPPAAPPAALPSTKAAVPPPEEPSPSPRRVTKRDEQLAIIGETRLLQGAGKHEEALVQAKRVRDRKTRAALQIGSHCALGQRDEARALATRWSLPLPASCE